MTRKYLQEKVKSSRLLKIIKPKLYENDHSTYTLFVKPHPNGVLVLFYL